MKASSRKYGLSSSFLFEAKCKRRVVRKCENRWSFFSLKFDYLILKTHFISLLEVSLFDPFVTEQQQAERRNAGDFCSWIEMIFFLCKIRFRTHMFIIWGQKFFMLFTPLRFTLLPLFSDHFVTEEEPLRSAWLLKYCFFTTFLNIS